MRVKGEVKCLHCGFVSGVWTGESGAPLTADGFVPEDEAAGRDEVTDPISCVRCGGPVTRHDASPVISRRRIERLRRMRARVAELQRREPPA